jgi:hypothetical protein
LRRCSCGASSGYCTGNALKPGVITGWQRFPDRDDTEEAERYFGLAGDFIPYDPDTLVAAAD